MKIKDGRIVEATLPELVAIYRSGYTGKLAHMLTLRQFVALMIYEGVRIVQE